MEWLTVVLWLLAVGLVVGGLARLIVSGTGGMGLAATIVIGIIGAFLGSLVGTWLIERGFGDEYPTAVRFVCAVVIATLLVALSVGGFGRRRRGIGWRRRRAIW